MTRNEFYVEMLINGQSVPSSAVANGTQKQCEAVAARLNRRDKHPSVSFRAIPCIGPEVQLLLSPC